MLTPTFPSTASLTHSRTHGTHTHGRYRGDYFGHYCIIGGGDEDGDGEIDIIGDEEEEINARHP